jgi:small subunit ribosomal protein S7
MSRRRKAKQREILSDPLFNSQDLAKFMNTVMVDGKKSVAEKIVYSSLEIVYRKVETKHNVEEDDGREGSSGSAGGQLKPNETIYNSAGARSLVLSKFKIALDNVTPSVEVKSRRVGGSTYQVPTEVGSLRKQALARRWMVDAAKKRNEKTMVQRLANEIMDALEGRGAACKKKDDVHRMAEANKAFAHFRW